MQTAGAQSRPRRVGADAASNRNPRNNSRNLSHNRWHVESFAANATTGAGRSEPRSERAEARRAPGTSSRDAGPEEVGEGDVVRVETTLVSIPVSVMDRDGKYIPDLRKEDFRVWEDGVEQRVAYFASTEKPFTVALLIDTSGSTRFKLR